MSTKTLTVKVRANTDDFNKKISRIGDKINATQNKINNISTKSNKVKDATNKWGKSIDNVNKKYKKTNSLVSGLTTKVKALAGAYLGVMGAREVFNTSDIITSSENKLNNINAQQLGDSGYVNGDVSQGYSQASLKATQESMDKMYVSAQKVRMGYDDMMNNVSKSITLAGDAFQNNTDNAIRFQEIMAEAYTLGGASAAEMSSSMYQMIQALGSGILQGDELRSVREGAPIAYKAIEEFAQGVFNTEESLKDLASQGKITSDLVVAAMMDAGKGIDDAFANTKITFAQVFTSMKNTAIKAFEPVLQMLNRGLNSDVGQQVIAGIGKIIQFVAILASFIFKIFGAVFTWLVNNWYHLQFVVYAVLLAVTIALARVAAAAVMAGIKAFIAGLMALSPLYIAILIIGLVIGLIVLLAGSVEKACGYIVGVIMAAISIIWNRLVTMVTLILKFVILPLLQSWDNFANFFGNLFNDPIAAIIHAFEGLADTVLSILQTIAKGIDAIFGSNLADAVSGWREGLASKADALATKYGTGTYEEKSAMADKVDSLISETSDSLLWNTADAYNTGYDWGYSGAEWVSDKINGLGDISGIDMDSAAYDVAGAYTMPDDLTGGVNDTANNTGKMADSMELADEDIQYLRDLAEMEWKKEYTTASIVVNMSNNNTISGDNDLDGIVTRLEDTLYERMNVVANGVYAY